MAAADATNMKKIFPIIETAGNVKLRKTALGNSILAAALTLPTMQMAHADAAPEQGMISIKHLNYRDSQPGWDRIGVVANSVMIMAPIAGVWSVEGVLTSDTVSGASPSYHSQQIGSGTMHDKRNSQDIRVTRYFQQGSLTVGSSYSSESDYISRVYSVIGSISTEDKNTTFSLGVGSTNDKINAPLLGVVNQSKKASDVMLGITQVLSMHDIVQVNVSHTNGHGYYSDPYKFLDNRPNHKSQTVILTRLNHHFSQSDGTGRFSYRYYDDTFGIRAHTLGAEYVQPLPHGWTVAPEIRIHSQTAASFYADVINPPFPTIPPGFLPGITIVSQDQRLSAFGAVTYGIKIQNRPDKDWLLDIKYEHYEQQGKWNFQGKGSPGLSPFQARTLQAGVTRYF